MNKDYSWQLAAIILLLITIVMKVPDAHANDCRVYSNEQLRVLHLANNIGSDYDLGLTIAGIVQQESFVGKYVIRVNANDYSTHFDDEGRSTIIRGSYGITHVLLSTAMWLEDVDSTWKAKATIVPALVTNDHYAIGLAIRKLQSVQREGQSWRELVAKYNGAGIAAREYAEKVAEHVN